MADRNKISAIYKITEKINYYGLEIRNFIWAERLLCEIPGKSYEKTPHYSCSDSNRDVAKTLIESNYNEIKRFQSLTR